MSQVCRACLIAKSAEDFNRDSSRKSGRCNCCKECRKNYNALKSTRIAKSLYNREYAAKNKDVLAEKYSEYYKNNKERIDAVKNAWKAKNKEKCAGYTRATYFKDKNPSRRAAAAYKKRHPDRHCAAQGARRARKLQASPSWADDGKIKEIYREAGEMGKEMGIIHHVDHIVPLQGMLVCGLHVESNLQILTAHENQVKSNRVY